MHIAIITKTLPPAICGIGDHSIQLGNALRSQGHRVTLVAGIGDHDEHRRIVEKFWLNSDSSGLLQQLVEINCDHLILQYTPLMFAAGGGWQNFRMAKLWEACAKQFDTSLIVHETYFQALWHPPSLIKGVFEKYLLKLMVRHSRHVFTASQPLLNEITQWVGHGKCWLLPIGSNVPFNPIDRKAKRSAQGLKETDIVLTLFGGGEGLRRLRHYANRVDSELGKNGISARWLLLGGVPSEWFSFSLPIMTPGFLPVDELSAWLQLTDVFLMPHIGGLSAKRGALMAALQHGLPVVGTKGEMSDPFWGNVLGVTLVPMPGIKQYADTVLRLSKSKPLREEYGKANRSYFETHFTWKHIADTLQPYLV